VLRMKWVTLLLTILIFAGSVYAATFLTFSFVPTIDQHQFTMQVKLPAGTPLAASQQEATRIEEILRQHPSVTDVLTTVGSTGAPESLSFFVKLQDKTDSRAIMDEMRTAFAQAPGLTFSQGAGLTGATSDVVVEVRGLSSTKYADLGAEAAKVMEQVKTVPGLADLNTTFTSGRPEVRFVVDRQKAAELGLSTAQIGSTIRTLVNGQVVTTYRGDDDEADIRVLLDDRSGTGVDEILNLSLLTPTGKLIPLRQVARPEEAAGPGQILRVDKQPTIRISANVAGRPVPAGVGEVTAMVEKMELPNGMIAQMGGTTKQQAEGFRSLGLAMLLSVLFIYMVLASQFNSFTQPLLIMLALPLAIVGALLALVATGRALDMTAFIGFIMLMGLVTKNSILLVDFANRERAKGLNAQEAMQRAGPIRLRPILMTSLSMILAMIPLVLGLSAGGEFRQGMSIAIMGGLITSTLLTLLIVPVAYALVVGWQDRWNERRRARKAAKEAAEAAADAAADVAAEAADAAVVDGAVAAPGD